MKGNYRKHTLHFKNPSGTSRGVLTQKDTWFLFLHQDQRWGVGECGLLQGLSIDDSASYEVTLQWVCDHLHLGEDHLKEQLSTYPSILFGVEQAFRSLQSEGPFLLFPSEFTKGKDAIPINGLIWMGEVDFMKQQVREKIEQGFRCIKMKIGAIDLNEEYKLLKAIRKEFSSREIELRVDANGAFNPKQALQILQRLADLELHSIEQPIAADQWEIMANLCERSPLPIALDEELIGISLVTKKRELLQMIRPQYIILKPSLIGGWSGTEEWIALAKEFSIGWWVTSALESNVGLNAIAQWTYTLGNDMPQGLGTGDLFTNNVESPLHVEKDTLVYDNTEAWNLSEIYLKKRGMNS